MSAATRVRQVSTEVMHAIGQVFTRMHACSIYLLMCVHMPFGREPMTWMIIWEPSHGWSAVSDLIYFVDLRSASPRPRRPVSSIAAASPTGLSVGAFAFCASQSFMPVIIRYDTIRYGLVSCHSAPPSEASASCARCGAKLLLRSVVAAERRRRPADLPPR